MRDLGKLIVAKGLKKLPKVQKIAQSGHTAYVALGQNKPSRAVRGGFLEDDNRVKLHRKSS